MDRWRREAENTSPQQGGKKEKKKKTSPKQQEGEELEEPPCVQVAGTRSPERMPRESPGREARGARGSAQGLRVARVPVPKASLWVSGCEVMLHSLRGLGVVGCPGGPPECLAAALPQPWARPLCLPSACGLSGVALWTASAPVKK